MVDIGNIQNLSCEEHIHARLFVEKGQVDTVEEKERMFLERFNRFEFKQNECFDIPDMPLAYWETAEAISVFKHKKLGETLFAKTGVTTGDNEIFLRLWHSRHPEPSRCRVTGIPFFFSSEHIHRQKAGGLRLYFYFW